MLELYLIRHGQTDWNLERRVMGKQPIGLNETGRAQVQDLALALQDLQLDQLFSSPLQRAQESAGILNQDRGLTPSLHEALREIEYGIWVGKTFEEVRSSTDFIDPYANPHLPVCAEGESLQQVRDRAIAFVEELRQKEDNARIMLVSHADWIKTVILHYLDLPLSKIRQLRIDNASMTYLTFESKQARVLTVNHNPNFARLFLNRPSF
ncbi:MAG: histidine phosphatase family protein [Deltaproteobacteria bacterium]|nr:histidine phosphatase family protein [Deltaproteobacteria bacterium]